MDLILILIFYIVKSKFRHFGPKIQIWSDLFENMYNRQFEGTEYKSQNL